MTRKGKVNFKEGAGVLTKSNCRRVIEMRTIYGKSENSQLCGSCDCFEAVLETPELMPSIWVI